jgi:hypothetical protein
LPVRLGLDSFLDQPPFLLDLIQVCASLKGFAVQQRASLPQSLLLRLASPPQGCRLVVTGSPCARIPISRFPVGAFHPLCSHHPVAPEHLAHARSRPGGSPGELSIGARAIRLSGTRLATKALARKLPALFRRFADRSPRAVPAAGGPVRC